MAQPAAPVPASPLDRTEPWTEEAYFALPADPRVELLDGSLLVSPSSRIRHHVLAAQLRTAMHEARPRGLRVVPEINLRVGPDRIFIPDLTVIDAAVDLNELVADAADARFVAEIGSPSTLLVDRLIKPRAYADAGIPTMLRVEFTRDGPVGLLSRLEGPDYRLVQRAEPGEVLRLAEPFEVSLNLAALLADG